MSTASSTIEFYQVIRVNFDAMAATIIFSHLITEGSARNDLFLPLSVYWKLQN